MSSAYVRRTGMMTEADKAVAEMQGFMREAIASGGDTTEAQRAALRDKIVHANGAARRLYSQLWLELGLGAPTQAEIRDDGYMQEMMSHVL